MTIEVEFADGDAGNALADLNACCEAANDSERDELLDILYGHILEQLATKPPKKLRKYLIARSPWRVEQGHAVYRTVDRPRVAYCVLERDGDPVILVLGFCLDFPAGEQAWWDDVIKPRLIEHL